MQVSYDALTGQKKYHVSGFNSETITELKSLITKKDSVVAIISPTQFRVLAEDKSIVEFESEKPESLSHWLKEFDILNYDFMKQPHDYIVFINSRHANAFLQNNNPYEPYYFQFDISMEGYTGHVNKQIAFKALKGDKCTLRPGYDFYNTTQSISSDNFAGVPRIIGYKQEKSQTYYPIENNYLYSLKLSDLPWIYNNFENSKSEFKSKLVNNGIAITFKISEQQFDDILDKMSFFAKSCKDNSIEYHYIPNPIKPWQINCIYSVYKISKETLNINYAEYLDSEVFSSDLTHANSFSLTYLKLENAPLVSQLNIWGEFVRIIADEISTYFQKILHVNLGLFNEIRNDEVKALFLKNINLFTCKNSANYLTLFEDIKKYVVSGEKIYLKNAACFGYSYNDISDNIECSTIAKFEDNFVHEIDCEKAIVIDENQCWYEN